MKKICVFTLYGEKGASSRYRAFIYRNEIDNQFEAKWFSFWNNKYVEKYMHHKKKHTAKIAFQYTVATIKRWYQLSFIAPKSDVVFIQKESIPRLSCTFLKRVKEHGTRIVYDVDDANYTREGSNSDEIARIADYVIVGNETLQEHYRQINNRCGVLPTVEKTQLYRPYWNDTFDKKVIGWIGSSATVDNLEIVVDAISKIVKAHPEVQVHIISDTDGGLCASIPNSKLIKWNLETYVRDIGEFTIGIMPLHMNEYNKGKCGFKLIQYLNMRKPVIGTNLGVNSEIIDKNGLVVDNQDQWQHAIEALLFDHDFYNDCVSNIDNRFFEKYSFESVSARLIQILNGEIS